MSGAADGSRASGSVWEGDSGTAVSDTSFSEPLKHMPSHRSMQAETKPYSLCTQTDTEQEGNGEMATPTHQASD